METPRRDDGRWKGLRVALVKSAAYRDLYTHHYTPNGILLTTGAQRWSSPSRACSNSPRELLLSTHQRTGPFALIHDLNADFLIVKDEPDEECMVWKERQARESNHPFYTIGIEQQRAIALDAETIDWSAYQVVIALENAVPARITSKYPQTLWLTQMEDHRMQAWKAGRKQPPKGYNGFLNLVAGPCPRSWNRRPHELEWPFTLLRPQTFVNLFPEIPKGNGIHLETNQEPCLADELSRAGLAFTTGQGMYPPEYYEALCKARFFLCPVPKRPIYGSAIWDAVAADCLVIGNRNALWYPYLIQPELHATTAIAAINIISKLAASPSLLHTLVQRQRIALEWFGWERPLAQLFNYQSMTIVKYN